MTEVYAHENAALHPGINFILTFIKIENSSSSKFNFFFHNITVLLCFWSNKLSLGNHKRLLMFKKKNLKS